MAGSGEHDVSFEVLLIGDSWVGKSCVAETYDEDSPHPTSLGRTMEDAGEMDGSQKV
ncbi:hypothetical protein GBAR_LOCUS25223 [Geodia barretti]|uniref:Uncharacterized protein n=1 Tax=Geodia barretti TaxID=519541 RepID=A0AA35XAQ8_GEOBA|nr:hypothetical protein GBAR_LOCUS25223 [Geodia barretti]